ncbi:plakophilin-1 isoform X2 [Ambystoma mexicanum]|uniref:plakophilin-1 isoform X2 n=1 Tax=Ambystoma mexicanum TaxID=8296 RepID=UPI0037E753B9
MLASPAHMKTALAYEFFQGQNDSSLALPSDKKLMNGMSRDQRVKEQILMTVRRQKPRSSASSTLGTSTRTGSTFDSMSDNYNLGGGRSIYNKSSSWGYQQPGYNGTLRPEADNRRYSSYSQMENWSKQHKSLGSPTSPGSDFFYVQNLKTSRSEPDLLGLDPRATLRRQNQNQLQSQRGRGNQNRSSVYSSYSTQQMTQQRKRGGQPPARTPSSISGGKQDVFFSNNHAPLQNTLQRQEIYGRNSQSQMQNHFQRPEMYEGGGQQLQQQQNSIYKQERVGVGNSMSQMSNSLQQQDMYGTAYQPTRMDTRDEFDGSIMTIEKAVQLLCPGDEKSQAAGACFIQHTCFQDENAKNQVFHLSGIDRLITLLPSSNLNVQQAAAGALRNLVFKNNTNKLETSRKGGIRESVSVLQRTTNAETQKQLTGLLWNLSSTDELKGELIREALPVLTNCVIIPYSGWSDGYNSNTQRCDIDPEVFFNATGCLRNLSSADAGRQTMRNCPGLVDSIIHYVQKCVTSNNPDDKSVENCACILHNLSYHLDSEVPNKYTQLAEQHNYQARNEADKTSLGCFSNKSEKTQNNNFELPLPEEDSNPKGANLLFHSNTIRMYLALLGQSKKDSTLEACAGALQNLTASKGMMSNGMSQLIGVKENGLSQVSKLLQSGNSDVVKTGTSLISNMSRHPSLHKSMGSQILPDISRMLATPSTNTTNSEDIMSSACYTMRNLVMANPQAAKQTLNRDVLKNVVDMCRSGATPKASEAARLFLTDMWAQKELQSVLKQNGLDKSMMGAITGSALRNAISRTI